jgi:hypothetical protein
MTPASAVCPSLVSREQMRHVPAGGDAGSRRSSSKVLMPNVSPTLSQAAMFLSTRASFTFRKLSILLSSITKPCMAKATN